MKRRLPARFTYRKSPKTTGKQHVYRIEQFFGSNLAIPSGINVFFKVEAAMGNGNNEKRPCKSHLKYNNRIL